jgi:hypothetical protein
MAHIGKNWRKRMGIYQLNLPDKVENLINYTAISEEITKSELMRRSIFLYSIFSKERRKGNTICIVDKNGNIEKEIILND